MFDYAAMSKVHQWSLVGNIDQNLPHRSLSNTFLEKWSWYIIRKIEDFWAKCNDLSRICLKCPQQIKKCPAGKAGYAFYCSEFFTAFRHGFERHASLDRQNCSNFRRILAREHILPRRLLQVEILKDFEMKRRLPMSTANVVSTTAATVISRHGCGSSRYPTIADNINDVCRQASGISSTWYYSSFIVDNLSFLVLPSQTTIFP